VHLVGFIVGICHDARPHESQSSKTSLELVYSVTRFLAGEGVQKIFSTTTLRSSIVLQNINCMALRKIIPSTTPRACTQSLKQLGAGMSKTPAAYM
jgi:hypothetical protein